MELRIKILKMLLISDILVRSNELKKKLPMYQ